MPIPATAVPWKYVKYALKLAEYAVPAGVAWLDSALADQATPPAIAWIRWNVYWKRTTPSGTSEDRAQFKLDLVNITGGALDTSWTAGDFAAVKTAFDAYLTVLKAHTTSTMTFDEYRAYRMAFNPADPGPGARGPGAGAFIDSGAPVFVASGLNVASTGTGVTIPYQIAQTVTLRTAWPKHWGRMYLPTPAATDLDGYGRFAAGDRTAIANGTHALVDALASAGFLPVIPVTQLEKSTFHALLGVSELVVDDVPDVQRRRRPKQTLARTIGA